MSYVGTWDPGWVCASLQPLIIHKATPADDATGGRLFFSIAVAMGMGPMPSPIAGDHITEGGEPGFPTQFVADFFTGTNQHGRISGATWGDFYRDPVARDFACCVA